MYKRYKFLLACCTLAAAALLTASWRTDTLQAPGADITNGIIHAHLYLPDADNGYYRAVRFDWSGVISSLTCGGHQYYGQWFPKYGPTINDAIMGPAEAFDPIGYEEAKPGQTFVKIGVGELVKPDSLPYNFMRYYEIADHGKWKVQAKKDEVRFEHTLHGKTCSYAYAKTVQLIRDKPIMTISHTLKNTGATTITTQVFDHNFMVMDSQLTGPGFTVILPDTPEEKVSKGMEDYAELRGNQLVYLKALNGKSVSFKDLTNGKGAGYRIAVENHTTGAGVRITANQPIAKMVLWSWTKTICPEPYIQIHIAPGETAAWTITYEYYNCTITKN